MAYFKKADRASVNIYATNLAKLGSADNAFVDLATLCEEQELICRITEEDSIMPTETRDNPKPDYACPTRQREQNSYNTMLDDSAATKTNLSVLPKEFQTPVYKLFKAREERVRRESE